MKYHVLLLRFSAIYAFLGAFIGSHMAGGRGYELRPIHAHILVVGWLSLYAFSTYYRLYKVPQGSRLAMLHVWSAIVGSFGLTMGMWLYSVKPFDLPQPFVTVFYIVGGSILLLSFLLFVIMTFKYSENKQ